MDWVGKISTQRYFKNTIETQCVVVTNVRVLHEKYFTVPQEMTAYHLVPQKK